MKEELECLPNGRYKSRLVLHTLDVKDVCPDDKVTPLDNVKTTNATSELNWILDSHMNWALCRREKEKVFTFLDNLSNCTMVTLEGVNSTLQKNL